MKLKKKTKLSVKETDFAQGSTKIGKQNDSTNKMVLSNVNATKDFVESIASTSASTSSDQQTPDIHCAAYGLLNLVLSKFSEANKKFQIR